MISIDERLLEFGLIGGNTGSVIGCIIHFGKGVGCIMDRFLCGMIVQIKWHLHRNLSFSDGAIGGLHPCRIAEQRMKRYMHELQTAQKIAFQQGLRVSWLHFRSNKPPKQVARVQFCRPCTREGKQIFPSSASLRRGRRGCVKLPPTHLWSLRRGKPAARHECNDRGKKSRGLR